MENGFEQRANLTPGNRSVVLRVLLAGLAGALVLGLAAREPRPAVVKLGHPAGAAEDIHATGNDAGKRIAALHPPVDDATLAVNVKSALIAAPGINATTIDVIASSGVITLNGTAKTSTRRDLAGYVALRVEGVSSVRNRILVISGS